LQNCHYFHFHKKPVPFDFISELLSMIKILFPLKWLRKCGKYFFRIIFQSRWSHKYRHRTVNLTIFAVIQCIEIETKQGPK
jgi:hypothetical protein